MSDELERKLTDLIKLDPSMMTILRAAKSLSLPDWCIAGGFVRAKVWDHLHGYLDRTKPSDIDLLYFDRLNVDPKYESQIEKKLRLLLPHVKWEPVNQARMHIYNQDPPYSSTTDSLSHWAETSNCVGVYLDHFESVQVISPLGLNDLFDLVVRPNLKSPTAKQVYLTRLEEKGWKKHWPKLRVELP